MSKPETRATPAAAAESSRLDDRLPDTVPWGYRPGIITAITVFLAFSLAFLRYWGFEAPGRWRWYSMIPLCLMAFSVLLQLVSLFRALQLEDVWPRVYRVTVRWFAGAVAIMVIGVLLAAFEAMLG